MAGDWIKMRVGLTNNPRVMRIAEYLIEDGSFLEWAGLSYGRPGYPTPEEHEALKERYVTLRITRYVTVTALLKFWGYANEHAKGEFVAGVFKWDIDEIVGVPGFADAIEAAGWALFVPDGGMELPNFSEHNTSANARTSAAERQKRYREKKRESGQKQDAHPAEESNVTRYVTRDDREEKRRIEKHIAPAKADGFVFKTELLNLGADPTLVDDWLAVRKTKKASNTRTALDAFMREVNRAGYTVDQALRICCAKSWKGFDAEWVKDIKPVETAPPIPFDREAYEAKRKAELAAARERYQREQEAIAVPVGVAK